MYIRKDRATEWQHKNTTGRGKAKNEEIAESELVVGKVLFPSRVEGGKKKMAKRIKG